MNITRLDDEKIGFLRNTIRQSIKEIYAPAHEYSTSASPLGNLSAIKLIMEDGTAVFFSAGAIELAEQVEVFLLEVTTSLELSYYPGGPLVAWLPIVNLSKRFNGLEIEHFRILSASWAITIGSDAEIHYGNSPRFLRYDGSGGADTYNIEDGVMLFCSDGQSLTISTVNSLAGALNILCSEGRS